MLSCGNAHLLLTYKLDHQERNCHYKISKEIMMIRITAMFLVVATFTTINVEACSTNYNFDYFLFATQWPESFCESTSCVAHKDKWAIHGAWPERNDGSWPQNCCTKKPYDGSLLKSIHDDLVANWGTLKSGGTNDQFWSHEYMKHGTCSIDSPLMKDELSYFKNSLDAFHKLKIDQWVINRSILIEYII